MEQNRVKIENIRAGGTISYYFQNEKGEWMRVPNSSVLSRKEYRETTISESAEKILQAISDIYGYGGREIEILFEGSKQDLALLRSVCTAGFPAENISFRKCATKIAVAGKASAGKTNLVNALCESLNLKCELSYGEHCTILSGGEKEISWYIFNLDFEKNQPAVIQPALLTLAETGLSSLIYCVSGTRFESAEKKLIQAVRSHHPGLKILIALTRAITEESASDAERISQTMGGIRVIPVLPKDMKLNGGTIQAHGVPDVEKYIFEGL